MENDDLMTRADIVRQYGRDKRTVERRLIGLEPAHIEARGSLLVRKWRRSDVEPLMKARSPADEAAFQLERLHKAKADRLEIQRQLREGHLVEIGAVFQELAERFANARTIVLSAPSRLAPTIANINATMVGEAAVRARTAAIREVMDTVLSDLTRPLSFQRHDA